MAISVAVSSASASAVTYDYTGSQWHSSGRTLGCEVRGTFNTGCNATYNDAGLAVDGFGRSRNTTPGLIDGFPLLSSERLMIDFAVDTIWHSITFGRWDRDDDARVSTDSIRFNYGPGSTATVNLGEQSQNHLRFRPMGCWDRMAASLRRILNLDPTSSLSRRLMWNQFPYQRRVGCWLQVSGALRCRRK